MMKMHKTSMKTTLLAAIACAALSSPSIAQIYQNDFTSLHYDPNKKQWVQQDAIYRDDNEKAYYIAQQLRPMDSKPSYLGITKCDPDMELISTWEYFNESGKMIASTETIDEMYGLEALILVGHYYDFNGTSEPYVMSVDKFSGAVNWFKVFPGLELTSLEAEKDYVIVTGSRPLPFHDGIYSYSSSAAIIMRLDKGGNLVWEREFEDDKYATSSYGPKFVYNTLNDVKRLDDKYFLAVGSTNQWVYKEQEQNLWDADGLVVMIDLDGNIVYNYMFGNTLPMDPNGQQHIQYELMDHLTYDPFTKTAIITGERLDNDQKEVTDASPAPQEWGLWVTKWDPWSQSVSWTNRYQYGEKPYRVSDPEIEHDNKARVGISYNFDKFNTIAMKLADDGSVMYHRYHYVDIFKSDEKVMNDIVRAFEYTNMTIVGGVTPSPYSYNSSYGWNIQAFDNILEKCEMYDLDIKPRELKFEIDKVDNRKYKFEIKDVKLKQDKIDLKNYVICKKDLVGFKSTPTTDDDRFAISQDVDNRIVTIRMEQTGLNHTEASYKATLYNALGQKMLETGSFTDNQRVDVSGLASGIYYLHVWNGRFKQAQTVLIR